MADKKTPERTLPPFTHAPAKAPPMTIAEQEAALDATRDRAAEAEAAALARDHDEAEAAAEKRGAGPDPVANKAILDEQFYARQAAEAAKADEGSSRPMVDERLVNERGRRRHDERTAAEKEADAVERAAARKAEEDNG